MLQWVEQQSSHSHNHSLNPMLLSRNKRMFSLHIALIYCMNEYLTVYITVVDIGALLESGYKTGSGAVYDWFCNVVQVKSYTDHVSCCHF